MFQRLARPIFSAARSGRAVLAAGLLASLLALAGLGVSGEEAEAAGIRLAHLGRTADAPAFLSAGGRTSAPVGHVRFCEAHAYECVPSGTFLAKMTLDERHLDELQRANRHVNESVEPVTDLEHYGETERWAYPDDGKGDCEDYVLEKRRLLMNLGWPASVLLITVVRDKEGDGHAVLTVVTDRGDLVLDNQSPDILPWHETGYRYVKRQAQVDPGQWVSLGETLAPTVVGSRR